MINLPTKILLAIKPMRTQFKFTLRLICSPEYKYTPEYIYTRVFFAHANWTYDYAPCEVKFTHECQYLLLDNEFSQLLFLTDYMTVVEAVDTFFSETAWPIKAKFYMKHLWEGGTNVYINNPGHMTKMAAMPIYGKNPSKIFFSGTGGPISKKFGLKHR